MGRRQYFRGVSGQFVSIYAVMQGASGSSGDPRMEDAVWLWLCGAGMRVSIQGLAGAHYHLESPACRQEWAERGFASARQ